MNESRDEMVKRLAASRKARMAAGHVSVIRSALEKDREEPTTLDPDAIYTKWNGVVPKDD